MMKTEMKRVARLAFAEWKKAGKPGEMVYEDQGRIFSWIKTEYAPFDFYLSYFVGEKEYVLWFDYVDGRHRDIDLSDGSIDYEEVDA